MACCDGNNMMGYVVLLCGCGDWRVVFVCVIAFRSIVMGIT